MRISFRKLRCRVFWNSFKSHPPGDGLETDGQGEHDVLHRRIADRRRGLDFMDALVDRHAGANSKQQNGDHEGPEIDLHAVAEGVGAVGRPAGAFQPIQQQRLVAAVDQRVDRLAQHRRGTGVKGGGELGRRDGAIAGEGGQYNQFGTRCRHGALRGFPG